MLYNNNIINNPDKARRFLYLPRHTVKLQSPLTWYWVRIGCDQVHGKQIILVAMTIALEYVVKEIYIPI